MSEVRRKASEESNSYRKISLHSLHRKAYKSTFNEGMLKITDKNVSDEPGSFWKGRGCVNKIFALKIMVEKRLENDWKLFAAFINLETTYGDRKDLWNVLRI